jgi:hypothetical protein
VDVLFHSVAKHAGRHCALTYDIADYGSGNFSVALYKSELAYPTQIFNKN